MEGRLDGFGFKLLNEQVGYEGADGGTHGCTMDLFIVLTLEEEVDVFEAELQECNSRCGFLLNYGDCRVNWH